MPHTRMITEDNINRFINFLEEARSDSERSLYQRLVVAELERFAEEQHRLDAIDRNLGPVRARIDGHRKRSDKMREDGKDMAEADIVLSNLHIIHSTLMLERITRSRGR